VSGWGEYACACEMEMHGSGMVYAHVMYCSPRKRSVDFSNGYLNHAPQAHVGACSPHNLRRSAIGSLAPIPRWGLPHHTHTHINIHTHFHKSRTPAFYSCNFNRSKEPPYGSIHGCIRCGQPWQPTSRTLAVAIRHQGVSTLPKQAAIRTRAEGTSTII
jgi:hypothetical protein